MQHHLKLKKKHEHFKKYLTLRYKYKINIFIHGAYKKKFIFEKLK